MQWSWDKGVAVINLNRMIILLNWMSIISQIHNENIMITQIKNFTININKTAEIIWNSKRHYHKFLKIKVQILEYK